MYALLPQLPHKLSEDKDPTQFTLVPSPELPLQSRHLPVLSVHLESLSTHQLCCTTLDSAGDDMGPAQGSVCARQASKASMSVISLDTAPLFVETFIVLGCLSL